MDTHTIRHCAEVIDEQGRLIGVREFDANEAGYRKLAAWMRGYGQLRRVGVEGTGAYGAGLAVSTGQEMILSNAGIFPDVRDGLVTFLELRGDLYDVRVVTWPSGSELLRVRDVGFPIGRGPILTDSEVVWESKAGSSEHRLWHLVLPRQITG